MAGDPVSILPWTALRGARGHLALLKKLLLERVSAVRRAMFIGVGPIINLSSMGAAWKPAAFYMPLLRSWACWEMDLAIDISRLNGAFNPLH
jgi:hypothetical protein